MPVLSSIAAAVGSFVGQFAFYTAGFSLATSAFLGKAAAFVFKAGVLLAANALLTKRESPDVPEAPTRTEIFSTGPARWILGRAKVGGVVCYWGEDWNVSGTEGGGGPGADDLHLIMAVSEGTCDAIEAVWVAGERLNVKFNADGSYKRRGQREGDTAQVIEGLPLDLDPGAPTYWDSSLQGYREREGGRILDRDDEDDAELIRRADLSGAVNIYPYLDGTATERWRSVRTYTDRADADVFGTSTPFTDWTSEHQLKGIAGLHVRLRQWTKHNFDERVFQGAIPNLQFLIRGIRIEYPDPDRSSGMVTRWTKNAAAVRYWWHRHRLGIPAEAIDRDAFVAAYRVCNAQIDLRGSLPETWPDGSEPDWADDPAALEFLKYSIDGVLRSGEDAARIEAEFDDAWQGFTVEEGGVLHYYPGADRVDQPLAVSGGDLLELPSWQPAPSITERTNAVSLSIDQSALHDYNAHSLREIEDTEQRDKTDQGLYLPRDLGRWRWSSNPAQAYSLGVITLRRARHTGTLGLVLPPGKDDDPTAYLTMSPGLIYTVNVPQEGIENRRMLLTNKTIGEDMQVAATFVDAPLGIYANTYELPDLPAPPPYTPTRMGSLPRKPTGLSVVHSAQVSDDGSIRFRITASVDPSPMRKIFRLTFGDERREVEVSDNSYTFSVQASRVVSMGVTARHLDKTGARSLPIRFNFNPTYSAGTGSGIGSNLVLPRPEWQEAIVYGGTLRLIFERVDYGAPIAGVEVRYTRKPFGSTDALPPLTATSWDTAEVLRTEAVQMIQGLDVNLNAIASRSGRYALYARYVASVSGAAPVRGPISDLREVEIELPAQAIVTGEEAPLFGGTANNLYKWVVTGGDHRGDTLLFPSHPLDKQTARDRWNGFVVNSSVTTEPLPRWPFGRCRGYGSTLDSSNRASTGILGTSTSTTYLTPPIDIGTSRRVEVKAEIFGFAPGTVRQSNLTFGSSEIEDQAWGTSAITAIVLPEAEQAIGAIIYSVLGLPAGLTFTASTRTISGTSAVSTASGQARYVAEDEAGGRAEIGFSWSVSSSVSAPAKPIGLAATASSTGATLTWTHSSGASMYSVQRASASTGPWTDAGVTLGASILLTGLSASTTYWVRVKASNGGGSSDYSDALSFTTPAQVTAPSVPTGVAEEARTSSSITIDWTAAAGVTSYEVRWKPAVLNDYPEANLATGLGLTEHTISGLGYGTAFDIQVRARNSAGASDWTTAIRLSTRPQVIAAPTISTLTAVDAVQDYLRLDINAYSELNALKIEVKADPSDGTHGAEATIYTESPPGPYQIYNVKPGIDYAVRVQAVLNGGAVSAWSSTRSIVFGDVPSLPATLTASSSTTSVTLTWTAPVDGNATSYRVEYWKDAEPDSVLFLSGITTLTRTLTGLDHSTPYTFSVKGVNANGTGLGREVKATTSTPALTAPSVPSNRRAIPISDTAILLTWDETDTATAYDIWHTLFGFSFSNVTASGVTATQFVLSGLAPGTRYSMQVRAKNSAGTSGWGSFVHITMPPTAASDYAFDTSKPISFTKAFSNRRRLNYFLTTSVNSGVDQFQIRYRQTTDKVRDSLVLQDWTVWPEVIENSYASGQRSFSGQIDVGYSNRYVEFQVRALIDVDDGNSVGFSAWYPCSNRVYLTDPNRWLESTIKTNPETLTAPVPAISQTGSAPIAVEVEIPHDLSQYETRTGVVNEAVLTQVNGSDIYSASETLRDSSGGLNPTHAYDVTLRSITGYIRSSSAPETATAFAVGDTLTIEAVAQEAGRQRVSTTYQHTIVDPVSNPTYPPAQVGAIALERDDSDVIFRWAAVADADGYEVRVTEEDIGALDTTYSYVAQTGTGTEFTKVGGRNEHYSLSVRAYKGSGAGRLYGGVRTLNYGPGNAPYGVGKVTGLTEDPDGSNTRLRWRKVENANSYQVQISTDGSAWGTAASVAQSTQPQYTAQRSDDFTARVRARRGTVDSLSWTAIAHKASTSPSGSQVGDVEWMVAADRGNAVVLSWDGAVPNAGRFRLERKVGAGAWTLISNAIAASSSAYSTTFDASVTAAYRIRGETDESNGAWTTLYWTGSTLLPIGSVENVRVVTGNTSIEIRWDFPDDIYQAEVEYRAGSTGAWTSESVGRYVKHHTITGFTPESLYTIRLRAKSGDRVGAWVNRTTTTLGFDTLPLPTGLTINAARIARGELSLSWSKVTGATSYDVVISTTSSNNSLPVLPYVQEEIQKISNTTLLPTTIATLSSYSFGGQDSGFIRVQMRAISPTARSGYITASAYVADKNASSGASEGDEAAGAAVAAGTGASVSVGGAYESPAAEAGSPLARPSWAAYIPDRCFISGTAIDAFTLPSPEGGALPHTITITGLPAGLTFDPDTRTISGTPTLPNPAEGYATCRVEDAVGAFATRVFRWIIAGPAPSGWSEVGGGLGRINNPFQIECTTKGNIRPLLWTGGATNAHDIENDEGQARGLMVWFRCPTTYAHTARLIGASAPDYDLVVKVGDEFHFSDSTDDMEFVSVPGHEDGALIGVYRYASTTTSTGSNTGGDPLVLEWYPDVIEAPAEASGSAESASSEEVSGSTSLVPGKTETDVYLLYRNGRTGNWTRRATPLTAGWTDVGVNVSEVRFEYHLKRWENRAVRRITWHYRDRTAG